MYVEYITYGILYLYKSKKSFKLLKDSPLCVALTLLDFILSTGLELFTLRFTICSFDPLKFYQF
jgi:hypothetical protein